VNSESCDEQSERVKQNGIANEYEGDPGGIGDRVELSRNVGDRENDGCQCHHAGGDCTEYALSGGDRQICKI